MRSKSKWAAFVSLGVVVAALQGCAALGTRVADTRTQPWKGTRTDVELLVAFTGRDLLGLGDRVFCALVFSPLALLDLPLTVAVDALLSPFEGLYILENQGPAPPHGPAGVAPVASAS